MRPHSPIYYLPHGPIISHRHEHNCIKDSSHNPHSNANFTQCPLLSWRRNIKPFGTLFCSI
jgi:hypothetical protein